MSLMKLLSAGKSWVGTKEPADRYQMSGPGMLPKFGSGQNPFMGKKGDGDRVDGNGAKETYSSSQMLAKAETTTPVVAPQLVVPPAVADKPKKWGARLAGLIGWQQKKPAVSGKPFPTAGPSRRQLELSLDNVKPLRNDLSDADLEVVAVEAKAGAGLTGPANQSGRTGRPQAASEARAELAGVKET